MKFKYITILLLIFISGCGFSKRVIPHSPQSEEYTGSSISDSYTFENVAWRLRNIDHSLAKIASELEKYNKSKYIKLEK